MNGGGGGGGSLGTVQHLPEDKDIAIENCNVSVHLEGSGDAKFRYDLSVVGTPNCEPHRSFFFFVPQPIDQMRKMRAFDGEGGLQTDSKDIDVAGEKKTELIIFYRSEINAGEKKEFSFEFTCRSNHMKFTDIFRKYMVYNDYMAFTVPVTKLTYQLFPPEGYKYYDKGIWHPLIKDRGGNNPHNRPIVFEYNNLHEKAPVPVSIGVASLRRPNKKTAVGGGLMLLSGIVGYAVTQLGDAIMLFLP